MSDKELEYKKFFIDEAKKFSRINNVPITRNNYREGGFSLEKRNWGSPENLIDRVNYSCHVKVYDYSTEFIGQIYPIICQSRENFLDLFLENKDNALSPIALVEALRNNPEHIKKFFTYFSQAPIFDRWELKHILPDLKKFCSHDVYDDICVIMLEPHLKALKKPKNKIMANFILDGVSNEVIFNKYHALIPNNEVKDIYEDLAYQIFEINISKNNLYNLFSFDSKDDYNSMHDRMIEKFNKSQFLKEMGLIEIVGEVKFKSSSHFRYTFRVKDKGELNKNEAIVLIKSFYDMYYHTLKDNSQMYERDKINSITQETIHHAYLNAKLPTKTNHKTKLKV